MDPYEEYMRSLRPDLYPQTPAAPSYAPTGLQSPKAGLGGFIKGAGDLASGGLSLYATYKALESAQEEQNRQRQREAQADFLATEDRNERRRQTGRGEMFQNANYSGDMLEKLMNMYRGYNGGYFNLHG